VTVIVSDAGEKEAWNLFEGVEWAVPEHSRKQVNRAGDALVGTTTLADIDDEQLAIINNWRASHNYPMTLMANALRAKAFRVDETAIVAQRLKRIPAIRDKLIRLPTFTLSQMQDVGGCRAIVAPAERVHALRDSFLSARFAHDLHKKDDYLAAPRPTGYRGVHLIYKISSAARPAYDGLRVEIQLRSVRQHRWATAVETIANFRGEALKNDVGDAQWRRLFALLSCALAFQEDTAPVPGTPHDLSDLADEIEHQASALEMEGALATYGAAINESLGKSSPNDHYFLLHLDWANKRIGVKRFSIKEAPQATEAYQQLEKDISGTAGAQAVLVSVDAMHKLRQAYPNFFFQTQSIAELVKFSLELLRDPANADFEWMPASASPASEASQVQPS